ncbi:hypothetical protein DLAC_11346 [Tieghemostelium lacteum]|uniref:Ubiquitin-like domain-containing protein n=1 Tax=Tieghemostelium lacteum TaxID=361077 RepID=A0A151Z3T3_TIELA|nr:hypothetical protein DLAC_11346 [Tieghemostelium lacteum]|eukprot:KYQ88605.1 hypothetical protein DLAC_11346 [Tieghemostelium lacteum]
MTTTSPNSIDVKVMLFGEDVPLQLTMTKTSTIMELKNELSIKHSLKPEPANQKLILGGKILLDDQKLDDIFTPFNSKQNVIYMVLKNRQIGAPTSTSVLPTTTTPLQQIFNNNNNPFVFPQFPVSNFSRFNSNSSTTTLPTTTTHFSSPTDRSPTLTSTQTSSSSSSSSTLSTSTNNNNNYSIDNDAVMGSPTSFQLPTTTTSGLGLAPVSQRYNRYYSPAYLYSQSIGLPSPQSFYSSNLPSMSTMEHNDGLTELDEYYHQLEHIESLQRLQNMRIRHQHQTLQPTQYQHNIQNELLFNQQILSLIENAQRSIESIQSSPVKQPQLFQINYQMHIIMQRQNEVEAYINREQEFYIQYQQLQQQLQQQQQQQPQQQLQQQQQQQQQQVPPVVQAPAPRVRQIRINGGMILKLLFLGMFLHGGSSDRIITMLIIVSTIYFFFIRNPPPPQQNQQVAQQQNQQVVQQNRNNDQQQQQQQQQNNEQQQPPQQPPQQDTIIANRPQDIISETIFFFGVFFKSLLPTWRTTALSQNNNQQQPLEQQQEQQEQPQQQQEQQQQQ